MTAAIFRTAQTAFTSAAILALVVGAANAQTATGSTAQSEPTRPIAEDMAAPSPAVTLELNRLESVDGICRSYFVVGNNMSEPLREMQLDTFFFSPDEVVNQRVALIFENVRAQRDKVVLFDLDLECDAIGSVLINEMLTCTASSGPVEGCADTLEVSSKAEQELRY